ncbi:hypothetical protein PIB30_107142, partial [Stylosanthes scabra]|nr:hypothetical protein [Stylosanthes scabra]
MSFFLSLPSPESTNKLLLPSIKTSPPPLSPLLLILLIATFTIPGLAFRSTSTSGTILFILLQVFVTLHKLLRSETKCHCIAEILNRDLQDFFSNLLPSTNSAILSSSMRIVVITVVVVVVVLLVVVAVVVVVLRLMMIVM